MAPLTHKVWADDVEIKAMLENTREIVFASQINRGDSKRLYAKIDLKHTKVEWCVEEKHPASYEPRTLKFKSIELAILYYNKVI